MERGGAVSMALLAVLVAVLLSLPGDGGQVGAVEPQVAPTVPLVPVAPTVPLVPVEPVAKTATIMIPAAAFVPQSLWRPGSPDLIYFNEGDSLESWGLGVPGFFQAPVVFPEPEVKVQGITLYAKHYPTDSDDGSEVCVSLYRSQPALRQWGTILHGQVCTTASTSVSFPQVVHGTFTPLTVNTAIHGSYLRVTGLADDFQSLYGVQVTYTYETGS